MELSEEQTQLINRVANENGFSDYQVITNPGSFKGDNFLGILIAVTLKSSDKTLDLILKSAHTNEAFRKAMPLRETYEREIYLYERIFGEFNKFQEENNILDPFKSTAKLYGFSLENEQECFIMENLKPAGYRLWDKKVPMNPEHVTAVLREYAKFHATSLAMKNKNPKLFDKLAEKISQGVFEDMMTDDEKFNKYVKSVMVNGYKTLEDDPVLTECLQKVESRIVDLFKIIMKDPEYKLVISHGDCWCNNFLFKYKNSKDTKTPLSLRILDWQISSLSSPASDISYFFLINSSKDILDDYETYLQIYYDTLCAHLRNFKCDPEKVFPYSTFEKHLQKFMIFGLYMAITILKIMSCDSDEAPDLSKSSEEDGDIIKSMDFKIKNYDQYKERLRNVVQFVHNNNFV